MMLSRNLLQSVASKTVSRTSALAFSTSAISNLQLVRQSTAASSKVPAPTEAVPDVQTFLTKIGRKSVDAADNFESWQDLFTMSSYEMKSKGIETRTRR